MVAGAVTLAVVLVVAVGVAVLDRSSGSGASEPLEPSQSTTTSRPGTSVPDMSTPEGMDGSARRDDGSGLPVDRTGKAESSDRTIQDGIIQREYLVLRPSWVTPDMRLPVVVALHGLLADRWAMIDGADWRGAVQRRGFVAVFPQGFANSWNSGECCVPSSLLGTDDVGFLDSVIDAVGSSEPVDPDRVYMTGFSAGGLMTYRYGCERSDRLGAIAPIAGSNLSGCAPTGPLSLLHQHSDPDPVVPYDGGLGVGQLLSSGALPSVPDSVARWASAVGCDPDAGTDELSPGVRLTRWKGCPTGTSVELVRVTDLGHEWPRTRDYDGLAEMLDFFGIN